MKFELPESFDEWPIDDQIEYIESIETKVDLINAVFEEHGLEDDVSSGAAVSVKKRGWAKLFLAANDRGRL